jgi:hypothetical protein
MYFPFEEVQVVMLPSNKFLEWPGTVLASLPLLKELLLAQNPIAEVLLIISSTMFARVASPTNWHAPTPVSQNCSWVTYFLEVFLAKYLIACPYEEEEFTK